MVSKSPKHTGITHRDDDIAGLRSEGDLNLSPRRKAWQDGRRCAEGEGWLEQDGQYFIHQSLSTPCLDVLRGAHGATLETLDGDHILDFHGNSVHQVGFGHPRVLDAIRRQLETLPFCTRRFTNIPAITLARRLAQLAPANLGKLLFAPGGAAVVGIAIKLARIVTGRHKTISMWDSFHGASLDTISVGGEAIFRKDAGPLLPGTAHVPPPNPRHCPFRCGDACNLQCAEYVAYVLDKEGDVAAVISETVRSVPYIPPPDYWKVVRQACDRHGTLLILDEIPHCLGRTGKMFTCEHYEVAPDMLVIGKGLGGGVLPLAALIARDDLDVAADRALGHYTHEKSPVCCAAALATLDVIEEEGLLARTTTLGRRALERLEGLCALPAVAEARGLGLLLGLELQDEPSLHIDGADLAEDVLYRCLSAGLSFKISMGTVLTLAPPLTITEDELQRALHILERALREALMARGAPADAVGD